MCAWAAPARRGHVGVRVAARLPERERDRPDECRAAARRRALGRVAALPDGRAQGAAGGARRGRPRRVRVFVFVVVRRRRAQIRNADSARFLSLPLPFILYAPNGHGRPTDRPTGRPADRALSPGRCATSCSARTRSSTRRRSPRSRARTRKRASGPCRASTVRSVSSAATWRAPRGSAAGSTASCSATRSTPTPPPLRRGRRGTTSSRPRRARAPNRAPREREAWSARAASPPLRERWFDSARRRERCSIQRARDGLGSGDLGSPPRRHDSAAHHRARDPRHTQTHAPPPHPKPTGGRSRISRRRATRLSGSPPRTMVRPRTCPNPPTGCAAAVLREPAGERGAGRRGALL